MLHVSFRQKSFLGTADALRLALSAVVKTAASLWLEAPTLIGQ